MRPELVGRLGPDYQWCKYGLSRVPFRGPPKPLDGRFVACIGGTETFGKFIERPYPDTLGDITGEVTVNFGVVNAGPGLFEREPAILAACHDAVATVVQVMGVPNQSNRFYTVHARRNDRFIRPTAALETLYPDIDFADFIFTRHFLLALQQASEERFQMVREELQENWVTCMSTLLRRVTGPKILLWMSKEAVPQAAGDQDILHDDPLFVTREMLDRVQTACEAVVHSVHPDTGDGPDGLHCHPMEQASASMLLGQQAHEEAAQALAAVLAPYLED